MSPGRWRLALCVDLPELVEAELAGHFDVVRIDGAVWRDKATLPDTLRGFDALLLFPTLSLDASVIEALPERVRAIATYSVGVEHIDVAAATRRDIAVLNTPGALTDAVAETAMLLLLGAARRVTEHVDILRSRRWSGVAPRQLLGMSLVGKRLGVLGMGRIGSAVAVRAASFGMSIGYHNRAPRADSGDRQIAYHPTLAGLLGSSDVLMICCPGTPDTAGLIDAARLEQLTPEAIVVNVARGNVVNDDALIGALRSGRVRAAGLDVFNNEPRIDPRYFDLPNVFMLPHIGSATIEARLRMGRALIEGLEACRRRGGSRGRPS